jgi:lactoylglutathione lyase
LCAAWAAPGAPAERPRLLGLSHVALRVSDVERSRAFYVDFLGYAPAPGRAPGAPLLIAVNERQFIELRPGLDPAEDRLEHVALSTDSADAMRAQLSARGVATGSLERDAGDNPAFVVSDPEGRRVFLVEHVAKGWPRRAAPAASTPVSRRILHAGILVGDLDAANRFYGDRLGLAEVWRGSRSGTELSWTNMKVPDGQDYLEFMLYGALPAPDARGTQHHICLEVADVEQAKALLLERPYAKSYSRPLEVRVGTNKKRQLNLYDPDGTRVELMEAETVDRRPVPSSTAPPPRRP